ncbi:PREDICTED: pericentrin-like, partial [Mesitornis unicolor]|uniref:pericentrin-like n=1 Tax=Mesitornis unicolor TaxID=54374 RepID=UPI0005291AF4
GSTDLSNWDVLNDHVAEKVMINSAADYGELDAKMYQERITELENRLLEKQEAAKRLTAKMDELQEQLTQHSDSVQLQETTVQEQNEVIRKLTACLQQTKKDRDDLQGEASCVAAQIHSLQLQLHQVNEMLRSKSPGKTQVLEAQQQMSLFQNRLKEQNAHLEMLRQKAHDLEVQLESSQKVHEREHDREIAELITKHEEEMEKLRAELNKNHQHLLDELRQQMIATHKAEIEQAQLQSQTLRSLELEALRLSLNNMHTSQLELTQSNLRKEKENALVELREMLNDKRAQEVAILQSRHQLEWEKIKEQYLKEKEDLESKYQQELVKCVELERQHQLAITKLQEQLQTEHNQLLEDVKIKSKEKEQNLQNELEKLQVMHEELKTRSQEELKQLWSQLDSTRANRQELSELKEQLLARASRVEEIERLKQEFEQQCQQRKSEHETELEQLRLYFEKKLRVTEENYREELTLLHQRIQELQEYSLSELE